MQKACKARIWSCHSIQETSVLSHRKKRKSNLLNLPDTASLTSPHSPLQPYLAGAHTLHITSWSSEVPACSCLHRPCHSSSPVSRTGTVPSRQNELFTLLTDHVRFAGIHSAAICLLYSEPISFAFFLYKAQLGGVYAGFDLKDFPVVTKL